MVFYLLLVLGFSDIVFADMAPPLQPPGANPGLPKFVQTNVQMVYELVRIIVGDVSDLYYSESNYPCVNAKVEATFEMQNQGDIEERFDTLFPLNNTEGWGDGFSGNPIIRNFKVWVNGINISWQELETDNPFDIDYPHVKWASFEIVFPPDELIIIKTSYDIQSSGYFPEATFYYILETGQGWFGPILEGDIILELPYEASTENILSGHPTMHPFRDKTTAEGKFDGNNVQWHFENLEPDAENNWYATIVDTATWKEILSLRDRLEENPEDFSALLRITELYDSIIDFGRGWTIRESAEELIPLSFDAYQQALAINPNDANLLARYAYFLMILLESDYDPYAAQINLDQIYDFASKAYALDPNQEFSYSIIREIEWRRENTAAIEDTIAQSTITIEKKQNERFQEPTDEQIMQEDSGISEVETEIDAWIPIILIVAMVIAVLIIIASSLRSKKA